MLAMLLVRQSVGFSVLYDRNVTCEAEFLFSVCTLDKISSSGYSIYFARLQITQERAKQCALDTEPQIFQVDLMNSLQRLSDLGILN